MADLLFLKVKDGQIIKLEGDNFVYAFVKVTREAYDHIQIVEEIYKRVSLIEHDPCVRDRLMARLFLVPRFAAVFNWLRQTTDEQFKMTIKEFKDCLSYSLFPATMEFERQMERKLGSGAALMRSISHIPPDTSTYFQRQWFMV